MSGKEKQQSKWSSVSSRGKKTAGAEKESIAGIGAEWYCRHPVFVFLLIFGVLMGLFYVFAIFTPFYKKHFLLFYLPFNARLLGAILSFLNQDIMVAGASISSPGFSTRVGPECSGIEPIALFVCAVLAFPAPFLRKIAGIVIGTVLLAILNFVRVVSLFLIGVYFPKVFYFMHINVWQAVFIVFAIIFWVLWLRWAMQSQIQIKRVRS